MPLLAVALLSACASTPDALEGEFAELQPSNASDADAGEAVRWGGRLLKAEPERDRTCFEVLSLPLGSDARPDRDATPGRRFLACQEGFVDPAAFPRDRLVTVTGTFAGFSSREIGDYPYRYPRVDADTVYLWPRIREYARYPDPYPFWYDPYYRPYWGPRHYWGPRSPLGM